MIARVWHGIVPAAKADAYEEYLARSDRGVSDYEATPGNRGAFLLRRNDGDWVRFMLVSLWDSRAAIEAYAGADIDRARYFDFDLECLIEPSPQVEHYEIVATRGRS